MARRCACLKRRWLSVASETPAHHWTLVAYRSAYGEDMSERPKQRYDNYAMWAAGFAVGIAIGIAIGAAMGNVGAGIAIGAGVGVALGIAFQGSSTSKR
jgi:hypothetical protein